MSQTLEQLSRKNDTLTSIRGIVRTMKTLSAINAAPYEQAAQAIEEYQAGLVQAAATRQSGQPAASAGCLRLGSWPVRQLQRATGR